MVLFAVFFQFLPQEVTLTPLGEIPLVQQYIAGLILLGVAPCTAMVLVWSYLAEGNMGHTLVMTANSLTMVFLYAPLATFLIGVSGIAVPWSRACCAHIHMSLVAGLHESE